MKIFPGISIARLKKIVPAATLLLCLCSQVSWAASPANDNWTQAQLDSITVLLKNRQFGKAVDLSWSLVDSLESQNAQGASMAQGLEALARSLRRNRKFREPETLEIAQRAVDLCSEAPVADGDVKAACLNTLGLIYFQNSEYGEALPLFEEATKLWVSARGFKDQKVAAAFNNQGLALESLGRNDEALAVLEKAAGIYELKQDEPQYLDKFARTTMTIAKLHLKLGNYDQAKENGVRAVEIFRNTPGGDHPRLGSAMGDLAALYRAMGDLDHSELLYEKAIPILEATYGPDHSEVGRVLNNLGNLRADRGDIAAARSCFERALVITEKARGPNDPQTGLRLLNLGSIMADLGDYKLAAIHLKRSQEIFQERLGPDHLYMGYADQGLGSVLAAMGELESGLALLLDAHANFTAQFGSSHLAVAAVLADLGDIYSGLGRYEEADQVYRQGLIIVRRELGSEHPEVAHLMHAQGKLALKNGDADEAETILAQALIIASLALGPEHPDLAAIHLDLSYALVDLDRMSSAFDHALLAERIGRKHFTLAAVAFEERRALQYAEQRTRGLGLATSLALRMTEAGPQPEVAMALWDELVHSRGLVLDLMGARQQHQQHTKSTQDMVDNLGQATSELAHLFVRGVGEQDPKDYLNALAAARAKREEIELKLAAASLDFARQMTTTKTGFEDVVSTLQKGDVLVSFLAYSSSPEADANLAALIFQADGSELKLLSLGSANTVENAVTQWRKTITAGLYADGDQLQSVTDDCLVAGRNLAHLIWDPLDLDKTRGRVYIVPDGAVSFVDFVTLPRLEGGYLVENDAVLALVSSERDLLQNPDPAVTNSGLLVMGGMAYGPMEDKSGSKPLLTDCGNYKNLRFEPLPGTLHEAETIAGLWSGFDNSQVHQLLGESAGEGAFKAAVINNEVIHLATHGFFLGSECRDPAAFTRGGGSSDATVRTLSLEGLVNPLLRAGLAFSGANLKNAAARTEDGILTAYEVTALDMSGVEMAVLSACNTGQGDFLDGEGVFGLQRAFAMAGARSLILSLWPVDDTVATTWMGHLYRNHLVEEMDYPLAARQASRKLLFEQRSRGWPEHPFAWSPFVRIRTGY